MKSKFDFNNKETWADGDVALYDALAQIAFIRARKEQRDGKGQQAKAEIPARESGGSGTKMGFSLRRNNASAVHNSTEGN